MISEQCIVTTRPHTSLFAPRHATINTRNDNNNTTAKTNTATTTLTTTAGTNKQRKTLHNYAIWLAVNFAVIPWILWTIFGDLSADLARSIDWFTSFFSQIKRAEEGKSKTKQWKMENRKRKKLWTANREHEAKLWTWLIHRWWRLAIVLVMLANAARRCTIHADSNGEDGAGPTSRGHVGRHVGTPVWDWHPQTELWPKAKYDYVRSI